MIEMGIARELYTDSSSRFDANMTEHYHFVCKKCNKLIDIFPEKESSDIKMIKKMGFDIDRYDLSVYGLCKDCKEADAV